MADREMSEPEPLVVSRNVEFEEIAVDIDGDERQSLSAQAGRLLSLALLSPFPSCIILF